MALTGSPEVEVKVLIKALSLPSPLPIPPLRESAKMLQVDGSKRESWESFTAAEWKTEKLVKNDCSM